MLCDPCEANVPHGLAPYVAVLRVFGEGERRGDYWYARCPAHRDDAPSLSCWAGRDGKMMMGCHAGCSKNAILAASRLSFAHLYPPREGQEDRRRARIVATYDYHDEAGHLLYQVVRMEPKSFRRRRRARPGDDPARIDRTGWYWNTDGVRQVLYRLPELLVADPLRPVLIVEGEKDADALRRLGYLATTAAGGAESPWLPEYTATLAGRHVEVCPDHDRPGWKHAGDVLASLMAGGARSVRLLDPAPYKDASDFMGTLQDEGVYGVIEMRKAIDAWRLSHRKWM